VPLLFDSRLPPQILDRFGPRTCCNWASLVQLAGSLLMLVQPSGGPDWTLFVGYFLLGFGGPGIQLATFHLANLFPAVSGSIIAAGTALFDAGTAVFLAFYFAGGVLSLTTCWLIYTAVVLFILGSGAALWPTRCFTPGLSSPPSAASSRNRSARSTPAVARRTEPTVPSLRRQLASRSFRYLVCFAAINIMRLNFVVGTFQQQAEGLGFGTRQAEAFTAIFSSMLPFGFAGMPLIGYALDNWSRSRIFLLVNVAGILCNALLMLPFAWSLILGSLLVSVGRQFVYSTFFDQLQRTAGPNYGKLAGDDWGVLRFAPSNMFTLALMILLLTQPMGCWKDSEVRPVSSVDNLTAGLPPPDESQMTSLRVSLLH